MLAPTTAQRLCAALLTLLLLTACASDEEATPPAFDAVLIELFGTTDTDAYLAQIQRHAMELVVICMEDAGFEFALARAEAVAAPLDPLSIADAEREGFGVISDFRLRVSQVETQPTTDPNRAYLQTLTAAEIERFSLSLAGEPAVPGQLQTEPGCNGKAGAEAYADWARFLDALPNATAIGEERDTHPDWLAARALWRDCMVDRGFDYAEPDAIKSNVVSRMAALVNDSFPSGAVPLVRVGDGFQVDPVVDELLVELDAFERDVAVANVECTLPIADRFAAVERAVQQAFVDRNRTTIDELLAASDS